MPTSSPKPLMVSVPPPSGEDKEAMRKRVRELGEVARVAVRQIRKKFKRKIDEKSLERPGEPVFSINMRGSLTKKLQEATDKAIQEIDKIANEKLKVL